MDSCHSASRPHWLPSFPGARPLAKRSRPLRMRRPFLLGGGTKRRQPIGRRPLLSSHWLDRISTLAEIVSRLEQSEREPTSHTRASTSSCGYSTHLARSPAPPASRPPTSCSDGQRLGPDWSKHGALPANHRPGCAFALAGGRIAWRLFSHWLLRAKGLILNLLRRGGEPRWSAVCLSWTQACKCSSIFALLTGIASSVAGLFSNWR